MHAGVQPERWAKRLARKTRSTPILNQYELNLGLNQICILDQALADKCLNFISHEQL